MYLYDYLNSIDRLQCNAYDYVNIGIFHITNVNIACHIFVICTQQLNSLNMSESTGPTFIRPPPPPPKKKKEKKTLGGISNPWSVAKVLDPLNWADAWTQICDQGEDVFFWWFLNQVGRKHLLYIVYLFFKKKNIYIYHIDICLCV